VVAGGGTGGVGAAETRAIWGTGNVILGPRYLSSSGNKKKSLRFLILRVADFNHSFLSRAFASLVTENGSGVTGSYTAVLLEPLHCVNVVIRAK
jgi:hypothetical protein